MWDQLYVPVAGSLPASAAIAALPIVVLLIALAVFRLPAWKSGILGLATAMLLAAFVYRMPTHLVLGSTAYGAAFGLFPIAWIVFWAVALYRVSVETGQFEIIKNCVGHLTQDRRLQALLIAFAFGAFIEGARGLRHPSRRRGCDARRPRILPVLCRGDLPHREYCACRVRCDRHAARHTRRRDEPSASYAQLGSGPHLCAGFAVHSRLSDGCDGRLEVTSHRVARGTGVRCEFRCNPVPRVALHRAVSHGHSRRRSPR